MSRKRGDWAELAELVDLFAPPAPVLDAAPPSTHASVLHACVEAPTQSLPPLDGAGALHARVWVPPPQATEHALHSLHPPSSTGSVDGHASVLQG